MYSGPGTGIKAYSKNGQKYMAAFTAGTAWNVRLKNLYTHTESTVCKNALGEKIDLLNFSEDQLVLVTFKPGQRIFIYEVTESKTCKLLNSAPVKYTAIRALAPTKSGLGVATAVATRGDVYSYNDVADDVFFINKDGRAPLYINLNTADFGTIISLSLAGSNEAVYLGYWFTRIHSKNSFLASPLNFSFKRRQKVFIRHD